MHMANRFAYEELSHENRCKVQNELYPLIVPPTIETIFGHWPVNLKEGLEREFKDKLNNAEIEFAACKQMLDRNDSLSQDALFSKFARNVCDLLGVDKSDTANYSAIYARVLGLALDAFGQLKLPETMVAVGREM